MPAGQSTSPRDFLRIVLVYEDFDMALRGKCACDIFAREIAGNDDRTDLAVWRFDMLGVPDVAHRAGRRAARADAVIVAPRDWNNLPDTVKAWLEKWPPGRVTDGGAFVVLFHPTAAISTRACGEALLLWRAAERAGMDLFCCAASLSPNRASSRRRADFTPAWRLGSGFPQAAIR